ncbi:peptidylprolyl isomerase [Pseudonocardia acidicola]|uniref:Parvulin peptidyl-prolyl isomerase n=1 Tax=Pseudonocardia acidicola TaxID=2724939 RepID=A0ABX1SIG7_9PSEU|nr:peptidyl-prolyl cis-trans isomerase [Pseudonocardia acidicola]NMI00172.1 parvulin peptidyl-prolyl isomerase [Pseudonocardia acidicola]
MTTFIRRWTRYLGGLLRRLRPPVGRRARIIVAAVVLLTVVAAGAGAAIVWTSGLPAGAALKVGDRLVTEQELQKRTEVLQALYGIQPPSDAAGLDRFRRDVAKSIAVSIVLDQAARQRDIVTSDKAARDILTKFIEQQFPDGGRDAFIQALGTFGASERDVLDEIKLQNAVGTLFEQVTKNVSVADADVRTAYEQRRNELITPEQRRLRNIVVSSRAEADQLIEQARGGVDFATLARQHSLDGSTRDSGGDLGLVAANILEKAYADMAFSVGQGEIFGPVQTRNGWNVGQAVEVVPAKPLSFEEAQGQLRQELIAESAARTWRPWVEGQIRNAHVEYASRYRPANPDAAPDASPTDVPSAPGTPAPDHSAPASGNGRPMPRGVVFEAALALVLLMLGHRGYLCVHRRGSDTLLSDRRVRYERIYRRSAVACQIVASVFVLATVTMALPRPA